MAKPFVVNRHGRLVFPSSVRAELDFSCIDSEEQLDAVVRRDFDAKAPTGTDILERVESGGYANRHELLRDLALNLFWANRYAMTMYEKRLVRWRDVPRRREDVFLPILEPWRDGATKVAAVTACYEGLPPAWDAEAEDRIHAILFDVYRNKLHHATELSAIKLTVGEALEHPDALTYCQSAFDADYPVFSDEDIIDCYEEQPELEALMRMAMIQHNQYPWNREAMRLERISAIGDDEFVVMFEPRTREVRDFIRRCKSEPQKAPSTGAAAAVTAVPPLRPVPPVPVAERFKVLPRIEALAVAKGEHVCRNEDLIRNAPYSWSPMSADEITEKTGIEARIYSERDLNQLGLVAARAALDRAGRGPAEIAAVIFCTCTSSRMLPSLSTWLSGELGIFQTHMSYDLVAACAGFPYGVTEAIRIMQDVQAPVLLVCAEKFSDKIGSVRPSRMIFGDGAAALVIAPSPDGATDVDYLQAYASGPRAEVNSIIWPNPEFDNDVTVWGPDVKALVKRYLEQMMGELKSQPSPDGEGTLLESIDIIVPHQANRTMVVELATEAGMPADSLYFNIDRVGNVSAASIPIAIHDAVVDGVIDRPMRVFAPGFGAGAVAGYVVLRIDPDIVVPESPDVVASHDDRPGHGASVQDVRDAFG
ncbi:MAG: 3-oxoacyl-[acyl-carrier-protein] synthase III C-terminal domain-containing protein [Thermoleophilia bacterium]